MSQSDYSKIYGFLKAHKLAVVSTGGAKNRAPESALIAYVEDQDLCLYFQTSRHSRKASNLSINHKLSFVIGLDVADKATLQYEGIAVRFEKEDDITKCKQCFADKDSPTTAKHLERPDIVFFKVSPVWIGFSDYSKSKPEVIELTDFVA